MNLVTNPKSNHRTFVSNFIVGFGDNVPHTEIGQFVIMLLMNTGYGLIAVPRGIVGAVMMKQIRKKENTNPESRFCMVFKKSDHQTNSNYC